MRQAALAVSLSLSLSVSMSASLVACHRGGSPEKPKPAPTPDAGVPDAEEPADAGVPDAAPATVTYDPRSWQKGEVVKIWRKTTLVDDRGNASADDGYQIELKIVSSDGDVVATAGDDCKVTFARGTAKVTGACGGNDTDVQYKLDLVAQLLGVARGTVTAGDRSDAFTRPLTAFFRLQDTGPLVTTYFAAIDPSGGASYAIHADLDGVMLKRGLHVLAGLDGAIVVDVHGRAITGTLTAKKARISGWPMEDYRSTGVLTLSFGVEPRL